MKVDIPFFKKTMNVDKLANALTLTVDQTIKVFKDGRAISMFTEQWAADLYGFEKVKNTNSTFDGVVKTTTRLMGNTIVCVRCLSERIHFQQSRYMGSGRHCTDQNLINSLSETDFEIIVDNYFFPIVYFIPVRSEKLLTFIDKGQLTPSGWSRKKFYLLLFKEGFDKINWTESNS